MIERKLEMVTHDGTVLDTVTLSAAGRLSYATKAAQEMVRKRKRFAKQVTDAQLFESLSKWSNGYVGFRTPKEG